MVNKEILKSKDKLPLGVKLISFIFAAFPLGFAIYSFIYSVIEYQNCTSDCGWFLLFSGVALFLLLPFCIFLTILSINLYKQRKWARITFLIVFAAGSLYYLSQIVYHYPYLNEMLSLASSFFISLICFLYLFLNKKVRKAFRK
jgi:hypothetical protein